MGTKNGNYYFVYRVAKAVEFLWLRAGFMGVMAAKSLNNICPARSPALGMTKQAEAPAPRISSQPLGGFRA